jgi:hypothetical protein
VGNLPKLVRGTFSTGSADSETYEYLTRTTRYGNIAFGGKGP